MADDAQRPRIGHPDGTFWKTEHVVNWVQGRPFTWIDDDIGALDTDYVRAHHDGPALLHYVSPRAGLLEHDFDALAEWAHSLDEEQP